MSALVCIFAFMYAQTGRWLKSQQCHKLIQQTQELQRSGRRPHPAAADSNRSLQRPSLWSQQLLLQSFCQPLVLEQLTLGEQILLLFVMSTRWFTEIQKNHQSDVPHHKEGTSNPSSCEGLQRWQSNVLEKLLPESYFGKTDWEWGEIPHVGMPSSFSRGRIVSLNASADAQPAHRLHSHPCCWLHPEWDRRRTEIRVHLLQTFVFASCSDLFSGKVKVDLKNSKMVLTSLWVSAGLLRSFFSSKPGFGTVWRPDVGPTKIVGCCQSL